MNVPGLGNVHVPGLGTGQAQAKAVLAHIAHIAATTPASSVPSADQFLYTEWIDGYTGNEVHDGHNYRLTNGQTEQDWEAPDGSGRQLTSAGFFHLLTPADNAQWLAAGRANDSGAAEGGGIMDSSYPKGAYFNNCGMLPTGPAGLSTDPKLLLGQIVARYEKGSYSTEATLDKALCILETSAYPPLRAATYRMIGELPGIESLGTMTDTLGRSGTAVAAPPDPTGEQYVVILDPTTGMPLEQGKSRPAATTTTSSTSRPRRRPSSRGRRTPCSRRSRHWQSAPWLTTACSSRAASSTPILVFPAAAASHPNPASPASTRSPARMSGRPRSA